MATNCPSHQIWSLFSCSGFDLQSEQGRANHCAIEPPLFKAVVMIALSGNPLSTPTACCVIVLLMCTYLSIKCTLLAHKVGFIVRFLFYFIFWRLEAVCDKSHEMFESGAFVLIVDTCFLFFCQAPAPMAFPMTTPQVPVYGMVSMHILTYSHTCLGGHCRRFIWRLELQVCICIIN